ncbi:MAG: lytic transglycosylase domain-containing protein [Bacillota bacterium]|nr:lytic transglycosylase domain-containing protein [Bacillota bacterium]
MRPRSCAWTAGILLLLLVLGWVWVYQGLYPWPYRQEVEAAAAQSGLSPALILAVMRTESGFRREAVSRSGALGLMQLMPSTAGEVALRHGFPTPSQAQLFAPEINILLGSLYLADLLDRYGGSLAVALAAYNAGQQRVQEWVESGLWDGEWGTAQQIPYGETRRFLEKVRRSLTVYRWLYRLP